MLPSMAVTDPSAGHTDADGDSTDLHTLAVDVQTDLQKLATGLAHAGASPPAVAQLTRMAGIIAQVVKVLGEGPALAQSGPAQPGPQQAPQPAAPPPAGPPPPEQAHHDAIHAATQSLHAAMQASAATRNQPQQP